MSLSSYHILNQVEETHLEGGIKARQCLLGKARAISLPVLKRAASGERKRNLMKK